MWPSVLLLFSSVLMTLISAILSRHSAENNKRTEIEFGSHKSPKITQEEQIAVDEFRPMVTDLPLDDSDRTDYSLLRWLRANNFELDMANRKLRESMDWRRNMKWDTILNETFPQFKHLVCVVDGTDKNGNIILYLDSAKENLRRHVIQGQKEAFNRHLVQCAAKSIDHLKRAWRETGKDDIGVVVITDMTGYSVQQHGCFSCLGVYKEFVPLIDNHYPGITKLYVVVNGPAFMRSIVRMLTPMLSPETANAVYVFGADRKEWQAFLLKHISRDQLSKRLGGTRDN